MTSRVCLRGDKNRRGGCSVIWAIWLMWSRTSFDAFPLLTIYLKLSGPPYWCTPYWNARWHLRLATSYVLFLRINKVAAVLPIDKMLTCLMYALRATLLLWEPSQAMFVWDKFKFWKLSTDVGIRYVNVYEARVVVKFERIFTAPFLWVWCCALAVFIIWLFFLCSWFVRASWRLYIRRSFQHKRFMVKVATFFFFIYTKI